MATYPKMTLAQLRTAARQRADMVYSQFVSDSELNSYINASYYELYDLLVQKYGNDYFMKEYSFELQNNVSQYPLPADFFKLLGVDLQISAGPDGYVSLRPFTLAERNRYSTANVQTWIGVTNLRYRISAGNLWFTPSPQTGQTIRIWYVPRLAELVDPTTPAPIPNPNTPNEYYASISVFTDGSEIGETVTVDTQVFTGVASSPGANQFEVSSANVVTTQSLVASINADPALSSFTVYEDPPGLPYISFRKATTFTLATSAPAAFDIAPQATPIVAKIVFGVNLSVGDTVQVGDVLFTAVDPIQSPSITEFNVGTTIADTVANIQAALALYYASNPSFIVPYSTMVAADEVRFYWASNLYFACSNANVTTTLYGTGTITPPVVEQPNTVADGISGWLEYVVTDAAIKMMQKEESDTSTLQFQKAALIRRIESAAENRDAGSPATIADVQWTNGTWPFGNGFGGGGGIP